MKKFTLASMKDAYTTKKFNNGEERIIFSDTVDLRVQNILLDIQHNLDTTFDLSYSIVSDAVSALTERRDYESEEFASVYTSVRLSYISNQNEGEISQLMIDFSFDSIATACAVWYDEKVREACRNIETKLDDDEEEEIEE